MIEYLDYENYCEVITDTSLYFNRAAQDLLNACLQNNNIEVIGTYLSKFAINGKKDEIIIIDIYNGRVSSQNNKIFKRERIGLIYSKHFEESNFNICPYQVVALRKDFPLTLHQNAYNFVHPDAKCLCLYHIGWDDLKYSWNPFNFLRLTGLWLERASNDDLHVLSQNPEPLYFNAPMQVALPEKFFEDFSVGRPGIVFKSQRDHVRDGITLSLIRAEPKTSNINSESWDFIYLDLGEIKQNPILNFPKNLFEFNNNLKNLNINNFIEILYDKIISYITSTYTEGIKTKISKGLLLFYKLKISTDEKSIEPIRGFYISDSLADFGLKLRFLQTTNDDRYFPKHQFNTSDITDEMLEKIDLIPLDVVPTPTKKLFNDLSALKPYSNLRGIIAGVGSLGGLLANLWARIGWGEWTIVDDDILKVHNLARHIGYYSQLGLPKVDITKYLMENIYYPEESPVEAIVDKINNFENPLIEKAIEKANLLIDVTTTTDAPRSLTLRDLPIRIVTVFINRSGRDSVLIAEDKAHIIRVDHIEPQYYFYILNENWGKKHLVANNGNMWVGKGCRDISTKISFEDIYIHAGRLSKEVRNISEKTEANIVIHVTDDSENIKRYEYPIYKIKIIASNEWKIIINELIETKLYGFRKNKLPNETGGIVVGYHDYKNKTIYIVDVFSSPSDSIEFPNSFIRGKNGIDEQLDNIDTLSQGKVTYIGEWHSHPGQCSTLPSHQDLASLSSIADELLYNGIPALMIIVGDEDISFYIENYN